MYDTKSYYLLIVPITKCENLSLGVFINARKRSHSKKKNDPATTLDKIIGLWKPDRMVMTTWWTLWTLWTLWTCGLCGPLYLRERTYFLILFGLLPFETMSVIPPFGNNLGKLCIETEVIYSSVMTYTVLRYLQKQPVNVSFIYGYLSQFNKFSYF